MSVVFDLLLVGLLVWIAIGALSEAKLFKSVVMFIVFS